MSRNCGPLFRSLFWVAGALLCMGVIGSAQNPEKKMPPAAKETLRPVTSKETLLNLLGESIETHNFQAAMFTLKDFFERLQELLDKRGKDFPILVDFAAFKEESPDTYKEDSDFLSTQIKIPAVPRRLTLETILRIMLS